MSTSQTFAAESAKPALMDPPSYYNLLVHLLAYGEGYGKTENVGAFRLEDIRIETETSSGQTETARDIAVRFQEGKKEKAYLLIDLAQYPLERTRKQIVEDMARQWGQKVIKERDLEEPDFKAPGIWVNKASAAEFDYIKADPDEDNSSIYAPNPEAYRITLQIDSPVNMPVQWDGGFVVETGGVLAIRERDAAALAEALQAIQQGSVSIEDALYAEDGIARFDIYGMEPGFRENNYGAVELKDETKAIAASLGSSAGDSARPALRP